MTLRTPNSNAATGTFNRSKNIVPMSGLCSTCLDGCRGGCDIWLSSFRGREVLYPGPYGEVTSGADKEYPVDFSYLNIQGYISGAKGLPEGIIPSPDTAIFTKVNTETEYGWNDKVKMRIPIFTGALGSTEIARKNWEHLAIGAAISGITLVCGENVCGMDPGLELDKHGKIKKSPEMDRRIEVYKIYHEGYGEMLVQMNIEDAGLGVAEYILKKHNISSIEIKWGQGAIGIYSFTQKFKSGLQQIMAGSRNFNLSSISRKDLMSLTEEATKVSGIKYIMNAYSDEADKILDGN